MSDEWMPTLRPKMSREDFERLPRHPSYRYEWFDGAACISPWPRYGHACLRLTRLRVDKSDLGDAELRGVEAADAAALVPIFEASFGHLQPYGSLDETDMRVAASKAMEKTFAGGDGVLAPRASFVATASGSIAGAILITLLPGGDPCASDSMQWQASPPPDLWNHTEGQPHLTWIFVRRFDQGGGIGTLLLKNAVRALKRQGYKTLWSTFMIGNESSTLWHWRNGFELLPNLHSRRRMRRELA